MFLFRTTKRVLYRYQYCCPILCPIVPYVQNNVHCFSFSLFVLRTDNISRVALLYLLYALDAYCKHEFYCCNVVSPSMFLVYLFFLNLWPTAEFNTRHKIRSHSVYRVLWALPNLLLVVLIHAPVVITPYRNIVLVYWQI